MNKVTDSHVSWSNTYSTGVPRIDDQHKELLRFVNDLLSLTGTDEAGERIYFRQIIRQFVHYIKTHFAAEEKLMIASGFPGYIMHKKAHEEFILTIGESVKEFESGKGFIMEEFTYSLKDWALSHIAVMDRNYSTYFQAIAILNATEKTSSEDMARA